MNEKHFKKSEETWDKIAKSFDKTREKPWIQCIKFINDLPKDSTIADFGCGNGRHLIPCAKHCKKVYGIDISKELLDIVRLKLEKENLKNVSLIKSNLIEIPLEDCSLDSAIYIAALHNIKNKKNRIKSLAELRRTLKKNKKAMISVWSKYQDRFREQFLQEHSKKQTNDKEFGDITINWDLNGIKIPRFYHLYSKDEFIEDLKKADLRILNLEEVKFVSKKYPDNFFATVTK